MNWKKEVFMCHSTKYYDAMSWSMDVSVIGILGQ